MRVAIVAPLVAPLLRRQSRGNHALIVDLASGLAARGHEVTLFAAAGSEVPGSARLRVIPVPVEASVSRRAIIPAARSRPPETSPTDARHPPLVRAFDAIAAAIRDDRPDVVSAHAFDAEAFDALAGLLTIHTLHLPPIVPAVVDAARSADGWIAAVSDAGADAWQCALGRRPLVLRNGVPDLLGPASVARLSRRVPQPIAVVAGRISPEKGTADAIRLARRAGLEPIVVGEVYDDAYHRSEVAPLLASADPRPLDRRSLATLLARATAALMPIHWDEPYGLVAAEAQMVGCPVIGYARGALPQIVPDGVGGFLVPPGDEAAFIAALRRASGLDRAAIRASALVRLAIGPTIEEYERALAGVARGLAASTDALTTAGPRASAAAREGR